MVAPVAVTAIITSESGELVERMPMPRVTVRDRKPICNTQLCTDLRICGCAVAERSLCCFVYGKHIGHVCCAMIGRVLTHSLCGTRVGRVAYASELQGQLTSQVVQQASRVRLIECVLFVLARVWFVLGARMTVQYGFVSLHAPC
jgi:hypothetical protein